MTSSNCVPQRLFAARNVYALPATFMRCGRYICHPEPVEGPNYKGDTPEGRVIPAHWRRLFVILSVSKDPERVGARPKGV